MKHALKRSMESVQCSLGLWMVSTWGILFDCWDEKFNLRSDWMDLGSPTNLKNLTNPLTKKELLQGIWLMYTLRSIGICFHSLFWEWQSIIILLTLQSYWLALTTYSRMVISHYHSFSCSWLTTANDSSGALPSLAYDFYYFNTIPAG